MTRTALVTGAGRGIGRGLALGLAAAGWSVGLVGRTRATLDEVADEIRAQGGLAVAAAADLVDRLAVLDAVARVEADLGGIDLLVNNAGVIENAELPFAEDDVEDMWRVVETNVRGPMLVTHAVLPGMLARGGGRIVNLSSGSGVRPQAVYSGYAISKGALARLTTVLHAQYADRGIRVLDLAPGVVRTDMTASMPVHDDRTAWTSIEDVVGLAAAFGAGELEEVSGRWVRAGTDTPATLRRDAATIVERDARTLRLALIDADDPVR